MNAAMLGRLGETAFKRAMVLGIIGAAMISIVTVTTLTAQNLGSGTVDLGNATFATDGDTDVTAQGIKINTAAAAADATEEATTSPYGALNNTLVAGEYAYVFDVFENGASTWAASQTYTIEVWETTGGTTTSLGTYNTTQAADPGVEGVTVTLNLGSVVPDEFDIIITKD